MRVSNYSFIQEGAFERCRALCQRSLSGQSRTGKPYASFVLVRDTTLATGCSMSATARTTCNALHVQRGDDATHTSRSRNSDGPPVKPDLSDLELDMPGDESSESMLFFEARDESTLGHDAHQRSAEMVTSSQKEGLATRGVNDGDANKRVRTGRQRASRKQFRHKPARDDFFEIAAQEIANLERTGQLKLSQRRASGRAPAEPSARHAASGATLAGADSGAEPGEVRRNNSAAENEWDVNYQGLLTKADIEADPAGHVSGFVAIIGRPNAGKSTLLNALVGRKLSIVSRRVQTTRHRILGIVSAPDHQAVLVDTPGVILDQRNKLEDRMMGVVKKAMRDADAIVAIVDASHDAEEVLHMIQPPAGAQTPPICIVLNKQDLLTRERRAEIQRRGCVQDFYRDNCRCDAVITTCAQTGQGVEAVREWMVSQLPEGPTLYPKDVVSEHPERFFVSEIIREHIFHQYADEIPYSVQVNIVDFKERGEGQKDYVSCELVCERESQKGILVGKRGSALKALATASRAEIERFLGRPIYLEARVRAQKGWREDARLLKQFGY